MIVYYCLYKKSCQTKTSFVPFRKSGDHPVFDAPIYLQYVGQYRKAVRAAVRWTISRVKHISSLFQESAGPWAFGDLYLEDVAILARIEGDELELFLFPGKREMATTFYRSVSKLPLQEIRAMAKPIQQSPRYQKQLSCYHGEQMELI